MSAPILFAGLPLLLAPVVFLLRRWRGVEAALATLVTALLAVLVLVLPLGQPIGWLGGVVVGDATTVMGRTLAVEPADRLALAFIFLQAALLFLISGLSDPGRFYMPAGLATLGLLAAALFVRPLMFAALFLELGACLVVFMLAGARWPAGHPAIRAGPSLSEDARGPADARRGLGAITDPTGKIHTSTRGALRYLVFATFGMPFILLTGWLLEASAASPDDPSFLARATILLGVGSAVLIGVVPFHSWMPAVAEHTPPLASAFVFTVMRFTIILLLLAFLGAFDWLGQNPAVYRALTLAGSVMTLVGALFAFGQRNFGRTLGYAMMIDIGAVLLAVGLGSHAGVQSALTTLALRGLALPLWGAGLDRLRRAAGGDDFEALRGMGRRFPFASAAVLLGLLSLVGFPLTAGFTGRWALWSLLAGAPGGPTAAILQFLGLASVSLVCARGLTALLEPPEAGRLPGEGDALRAGVLPGEGRAAATLYSVGISVVLVLGLFPQWILTAVASAAAPFSAIAP